MRKRRFRHRAPKSLLFRSILLPKAVLSPPFCIPNRSLPLDSAPRMPQAPILSIFDRFPGQKGIPKWLPFWSISGHFRIFIEKVRPLQNMHRRERIACPAVPGSSIFSKFELQKQRRKKETAPADAADAWSAKVGGGGLPKRRGKKGAGTGIVQRLRHTKRAKARWRILVPVIQIPYIENNLVY